MKLVAVIDLLDGQVVHARRGDRAHYAPVVSHLCAGSDPATVARSLAAAYPFDAVYVADIDAIQGRAANARAIAQIAEAITPTELWLDAGIATMADLERVVRAHGCTPVVGSESQTDCALIDALRRRAHRFVLSLDWRGAAFLGPRELLEDPALWPERVLAMNLARVGSGEGADLALVQRLHNAAPTSQIFASGGIRGESDLLAAESAGASGALLATALHDGRLNAYLARRRSVAA